MPLFAEGFPGPPKTPTHALIANSSKEEGKGEGKKEEKEKEVQEGTTVSV